MRWKIASTTLSDSVNNSRSFDDIAKLVKFLI